MRFGSPIAERLFSRKLLSERWQQMGRDELEGHLRFLILAEHRTRPTHTYFDPTLPAYRFRARRKQVAGRFVSLGGEVSRCVLSGPLPPTRKWPGIARLVKTHDFDLYGEPAGPSTDRR